MKSVFGRCRSTVARLMRLDTRTFGGGALSQRLLSAASSSQPEFIPRLASIFYSTSSRTAEKPLPGKKRGIHRSGGHVESCTASRSCVSQGGRRSRKEAMV